MTIYYLAETMADFPIAKPMRPSEYMRIQREAGSCMPQFKETVVKCTKFGFYGGILFGAYTGYRFVPLI